MLPKNLKTLKRSISAKFLGKSNKNVEAEPTVVSRNSSSVSRESRADEEDPYREILRLHDDNVSHLVLHGSSLRSMSGISIGNTVGAPQPVQAK